MLISDSIYLVNAWLLNMVCLDFLCYLVWRPAYIHTLTIGLNQLSVKETGIAPVSHLQVLKRLLLTGLMFCVAVWPTAAVYKDTTLSSSQMYRKQLPKPRHQYTACVCGHTFLFVCVFSFPAGTEINLHSTKENNYHSCTRKERGAVSKARDREMERQRERGWWAPDCHFLK